MARVKLEHIYKKYTADTIVVKDFNLDIEDKEFVVFVGPSGCGKTTTLRMIAGLEDITAGDLLIGDRRVNDVAPKDRDIAMVFQNYALYPHMSVYQNMAFGLKLRKFSKSEIDKRVRDAAKILDIEHLLERKPKALSGGQRQRVALGRAIVREPQVFLMDEPLSNLDAKLRVQMRAEIRKLHQRIQTTMIYVTHDQTEAMTMGDRIVVMKDGIVQQCDTPQVVYSRPANMFVAGFIGSPAMNFLHGQVVEEGGRVYFRANGLSVALPEGRYPTLKSEGAIGKEMVLGVRPEDVHNEEVMLSTYPEAVLDASVEVTEHMGSEVYLHVMAGNQSMIARVNSRFQYRPGSAVKLTLDLNKIHLFHKDTEETVAFQQSERALASSEV
ncbi:MAG: sn-glycerol-3-phosphate ABC transporter ATP-binding protein UgpC [Alicyclobacillaceae bacterium]|uniref:ABC transporter ATP-binding protein n=1 Tax=Alicyclobacillus sp. SP_1 TaxID=2942475 RepID=UPI002158056A|nr:sn-glycerol-3-phosphate ABC transporter ATP-binding protein UgpC [Alicyclobacillus sp. SP_1]MCY0888045.1 sn-glycerol-3-phosphate ABC transporter ATP-binding protein UgpC [Alicyclobacillaceae bacterium]MCY0895669.1 sn-glycerol-3-phosphate ABC transporter ATP-binding protein UgpC [Alicyclobacillaceae bacterium]